MAPAAVDPDAPEGGDPAETSPASLIAHTPPGAAALGRGQAHRQLLGDARRDRARHHPAAGRDGAGAAVGSDVSHQPAAHAPATSCSCRASAGCARTASSIPSLFVVSTSRGKIAAGLELDVVVDDRPGELPRHRDRLQGARDSDLARRSERRARQARAGSASAASTPSARASTCSSPPTTPTPARPRSSIDSRDCSASSAPPTPRQGARVIPIRQSSIVNRQSSIRSSPRQTPASPSESPRRQNRNRARQNCDPRAVCALRTPSTIAREINNLTAPGHGGYPPCPCAWRRLRARHLLPVMSHGRNARRHQRAIRPERLLPCSARSPASSSPRPQFSRWASSRPHTRRN